MINKFLAFAAFTGLAIGPVLAAGHSAATEEVVMSHLRGVGQLDLDEIIAPYSEDAVLITANKIYSGPDEIRVFFEDFVAEFSQPGISIETEALVFEGNTAMVTWHADSPDNVYEFGADTYIVENGMIVSHTLATKITPK